MKKLLFILLATIWCIGANGQNTNNQTQKYYEDICTPMIEIKNIHPESITKEQIIELNIFVDKYNKINENKIIDHIEIEPNIEPFRVICLNKENSVIGHICLASTGKYNTTYKILKKGRIYCKRNLEKNEYYLGNEIPNQYEHDKRFNIIGLFFMPYMNSEYPYYGIGLFGYDLNRLEIDYENKIVDLLMEKHIYYTTIIQQALNN